MKPIDPQTFDCKHAEAAPAETGHDVPVIRLQMNRSDWLVLVALALIWEAPSSSSAWLSGMCSR